MIPAASEATLTPQLVALASALVRTANADNASLHRALVKAEPRLLDLGWEVSGGVLQIQSYTTPGKCWETDGDTCHCKTSRGICWHKGAWMILSVCAAAGIAPLAPVQLPKALRYPQSGNPLPAYRIDDVPGNFLGDFPPLDEWSPDEGASYTPPPTPQGPAPRADQTLEMIEQAATTRRIARLLRPPMDPAELDRVAAELF